MLLGLVSSVFLFPIEEVEAAGWYNSDWGYRVKVTVLAAKVDADLTDYPIYVDLSNLPAGFHTNVNQTDARDIRVTTSDGATELPREVVVYDSATDTGELHIKYSGTLSSTVDTDIYIYYGNADVADYAATDTYGGNNVWESSAKMVQHLEETPQGTVYDSTSNNNNSISNNADPTTSGQIDGAYDFTSANSDYINCGNDASLNITDAITIEAWVKKTATDYGAPSGTAITNCTELQNMKDNLAGDYYLASDIDCFGFDYGDSGGFMPIGNDSNKFNGTLDGQGYKITDLYINRPSTHYGGLFGYTDSGSEIKNVGLDVDISGSNYVGSLVGWNYATITNSYSTGSVSSTGYVGGLVGYNGATITNSYSTGSVSSSVCSFVGGLVGYNDAIITNSYSTGSASGQDTYVGGLVGCNNATITNSYSTGSASSTSYYVGGLVGRNNATITNSYSTGAVTGTYFVGGLVGCNNATITNSYSTGSASSTLGFTGGLVGYNDATITNSYYPGDDITCTGCDNNIGNTPKTNLQSETWLTTSPNNWNFTNIWGIEEDVTYPFLQWQWGYIVSKGRDAYSLQMGRDGSLYGYINNSEITTSVSTPTNWHYSIMTFDGTDQKLFIDGDLKSTESPGGAIGTNSNNIKIGGAFNGFFNGAIDDVRIYNRVLSADEISTQYNNQNSPSTFYTLGSEDTVPAVLSFLPEDNAVNVALGANLVITFSENVDAETGNIVIKKASDDSVVETIDVASGQVIGTGTDAITINPCSDLEHNTEYYVQIAATCFDDATGNSYAGVTDTTSWSFTMIPTPGGGVALSWGQPSQIVPDSIVYQEREREEEPVEEPVQEMNISELEAKIAEITALIAGLQSQLAEVLEEVSYEGCAIASFDRNLSQGMIGNDVKCLQIVLNSGLKTRLADLGVGSPGNETNYFGSLTKAAVIRFQEKYAEEILSAWGLTAGTGYVGRTTQAKINELLSR